MTIVMEAYVCEVQGNRAGDRSDKVRVTASYESADTMGTLTFDVPIANAKLFHVGQTVRIGIYLPDLEQEATMARAIKEAT